MNRTAVQERFIRRPSARKTPLAIFGGFAMLGLSSVGLAMPPLDHPSSLSHASVAASSVYSDDLALAGEGAGDEEDGKGNGECSVAQKKIVEDAINVGQRWLAPALSALEDRISSTPECDSKSVDSLLKRHFGSSSKATAKAVSRRLADISNGTTPSQPFCRSDNDCSKGREGHIYAFTGSKTAKTNRIVFCPIFFEDSTGDMLRNHIVLHERAHNWARAEDLAKEGEPNYPPSVNSDLNADSLAAFARDIKGWKCVPRDEGNQDGAEVENEGIAEPDYTSPDYTSPE